MRSSSPRRRRLAVQEPTRRLYVWALRPWYATRPMIAFGVFSVRSLRPSSEPHPKSEPHPRSHPKTCLGVVRGRPQNAEWPDGFGRHLRVDSVSRRKLALLAGMDRLLGRDEVVGHELVYGELLIGDRGGRRKLLTAYERMHQAGTVPHRDVVAFVHARGLYGRGLGWIDVHLLAAAIVGRLQLWTADSHLAAAAKELGIAYEVPALKPGN
jgi:hypothetical protein